MIYAENDRRRVLIDPDSLSMTVELKLGDEWVETDGGTYPNLKVLSADFRDAVGFGDAYDILIDNDVPIDSDLWDLNHSNPWK